MKSAQDILDFWFSDSARERWFDSTDAFDALIREEYEVTARALAESASLRKSWEAAGAHSHLALIIALDQFPRNMYRDTPAMFAWDPVALASVKRLVAEDGDLALAQDERPFAYMPFMHSEDMADQKRCIDLCKARLEDDDTLKFAKIHADIIQRFGRFPHRNAILGRETTAAEQAFLDDGGFSG